MFTSIVSYFHGISPVLGALYVTLFTWGITALGASFVFLVPQVPRSLLDGMLGFTGGVMVAASFWSLLEPAIAMSTGKGMMVVVPACVGFSLGAIALYCTDKLLPHLHLNFPQSKAEGIRTRWHKTTLLVVAITLHNIPEGLAIGVLFGGVLLNIPEASIEAALILGMGIGLQNFPEGMAVAIPLRRQGLSRWKSFWYGQLSAIVEPIAGVLGALLVVLFQPLLPYALAFAAGAMIYVVVEEVIPESQQSTNTDLSTLGFILGFLIMMALDVGLTPAI